MDSILFNLFNLHKWNCQMSAQDDLSYVFQWPTTNYHHWGIVEINITLDFPDFFNLLYLELKDFFLFSTVRISDTARRSRYWLLHLLKKHGIKIRFLSSTQPKKLCDPSLRRSPQMIWTSLLYKRLIHISRLCIKDDCNGCTRGSYK